ncbi:MAG: hypothetical protein ACHP7O_14355, partial [Burkholderiales bacterium]
MHHEFLGKAILAGAFLATTAFGASAAEPITIGSVLSVTGPAAFLGDHAKNRWEVFTHEPNRHAQARAEIARRRDGILIECGLCRSFQIRS